MQDNTSEILTLNEVATYLKVAEKTVLRMIGAGEIPCAKVGNQWRFSRDLIDRWLLSRMQEGGGSAVADALSSQDYLPLSRLTSPALISLDIAPGGKRQILLQLVDVLARQRTIGDPGEYIEGLLGRERMATTSVGGGVAIPHLRNPEESPNPGPDVVVGICKEGTDYDSIDGMPTHLFFLLSSNNIVVHLKAMSRIARLTRDGAFLEKARGAMDPTELWSALVRLDQEHLADRT